MDAFKNFAVSAVATAPSPASSGGNLVVQASHGGRFPAPPFNATVWPNGALPDPGNAEIVRVLSMSSDTMTIARTQEGSFPRAIAVGDLIAATLTKRSLDGYLWYPLTPAVLADFTWVNQGTATVDTTYGAPYLDDLTVGSFNLRILKKAAPAPPYVITTAWNPIIADVNNSGLGLGWRDSTTGKLVIFAIRYAGSYNLVVDKATNPTTWAGANYTNVVAVRGQPLFLRIADNGTSRICSSSLDGYHFTTVHTIARTDFLTPDEVWFGLYVNPVRVSGTLLSWEQA